MKLENLLLLLFLFPATISCSKDEKFFEDVNFGSAHFLKVGHTWTYQLYDLTGDESTRHVKIVGTHPDYPEVYELRFEDESPERGYWFIDGTDLMAYYGDEKAKEARKIYRIGGRVGEFWKATVYTSDDPHKYEILSEDFNFYANGRFYYDIRVVEVKADKLISFPKETYWSDSIGFMGSSSLSRDRFLLGTNF